MSENVSSKVPVLIVDDELENLSALERTLSPRFSVEKCQDAATAIRKVSERDFAVVISDQRMAGMMGTELLSQIAQKSPLTTRIILTAYTDSAEILGAINRAEIYRYVTKPWNNQELLLTVQQAVDRHELIKQNAQLIQELESKNSDLLQMTHTLERQVQERTAELKRANEQLAELAMTDPLTKILNRRAFFVKLGEEIERSSRYRHPMVIGMVDVDRFKEFNDMEGHVFGDEALRKIAQVFSSHIRKTDAVGRYGGEEFILMMPETPLNHAVEICERLRMTVENTTFQGKTQGAYLSVSIGLAEFPQHGDTPQSLVEAADQALYHAKEQGRNRVSKPPASLRAPLGVVGEFVQRGTGSFSRGDSDET